MATTFNLAGLTGTFRSQNQDNDSSFQVVLPNGRNVELCSKEGADEFVDAVGTAFISTNLTAAIDDEQLDLAYTMMVMVAKNASPEKIASGIPESELCTFIEHTRGTLVRRRRFSLDPRRGRQEDSHTILEARI
jgi:hypothetical protein